MNPKFPENDDFSVGDGNFASGRSHKINQKIHDIPDMAENSKFHGLNVLMDDVDE